MKEQFSSDFEEEMKDKNSDLDSDNNEQLLNKIINTSNDNLEGCKNTNIEKLCNLCIKSKYTKIVKHKKMTFVTRKLQEIYADL